MDKEKGLQSIFSRIATLYTFLYIYKSLGNSII